MYTEQYVWLVVVIGVFAPELSSNSNKNDNHASSNSSNNSMCNNNTRNHNSNVRRASRRTASEQTDGVRCRDADVVGISRAPLLGAPSL